MRCRACNRTMEVRWCVPEGAEQPVLEELCSHCLPWTKAVLKSAQEPASAVFWPSAPSLPADHMKALSERPAGFETGWDVSRWGDVPKHSCLENDVGEDEAE